MTQGEVAELQRMKRVADQACTAHAHLRDSLARRALVLDIAMLALGTWLVALAFVDPNIARKITPFGINPTIWIGTLGVGNFFLAIVQLRVDWKARSDAHARSMSLHADLKREINILLSRDREGVSDTEYGRVTMQEAMTSNATVAIPERSFLALKRHHKLKVAVSKHLDDHPGASVLLTKIQLFLRDNSPNRGG